MTVSSFDQKYAFDSELAQARKANGANITPAFEQRIKEELAQAQQKYGEKSPQYVQLQRSIVAFANVYDAKKHDLGRAFETLHAKSVEAVGTEIARLKDDTGVKGAYYENGWNFKTAARAVNVKSYISESLGDIKFDFHNISPEERQKLESKKFSMTSKESWQETGLLLGEHFGNSIKDIALFFASIPASIPMISDYVSLRANRNNSVKNEATLALMLEEFPALALLDLATDWDKGAAMIRDIAGKLVSGTQGDVAFTIVSIFGLMTGGAAITGKLGSVASRIGSATAKATAKVASTTKGAVGAMANVATKTMNGVTRGGDFVAAGAGNMARFTGAADNVLSGQFAVTGAAKGVARLASMRNGTLVNIPRGPRGKVTGPQYAAMIETNANLSPELRASKAADSLNLKSLSDTQKIALEEAHRTGTRGAGRWTREDLQIKMQILHDGGFSLKQSRTLLEQGYAGKGVDTPLLENGKKTPKIQTEAVEGNAKPNPRKAIPDIEDVEVKNPSKPTEKVSSAIQDKMALLEARKAELIQWKKENPGNIRHDADLMRTEAEMHRVGAKMNEAIIGSLENPKRGDIIKLADASEWRYTANGERWQKLDTGKVWGGMDYTEGLQKTTKELKDTFTTQAQKPVKSELIEMRKSGKMDDAGKNPKQEKIEEGSVDKKISNTAKQSTSSQSDTTDLGAQARIDAEHGIGRKRLTPSDLLGGSFRSEMDEMMKMDDATFQKRVTEVEYRKGQEGNRLYEVEMYEAAAKIRKMSDADIISHADDIIKGNREFMGNHSQKKLDSNLLDSIKKTDKDIRKMNDDLATLEQKKLATIEGDRPTIDALIEKKKADIARAEKHADALKKTSVEGLPLNEKAFLVAENAALRSRLSDIINKKAPGLADDIIKKNPTETANKLRSMWPLGAALLAALLLLAFCEGRKGTGDTSTPEALAADLCGTDSGKKKGDIIDGRKSDAGATLTEKRRESISQKWMQTPKWKALVVEFRKNEDLLKGSRFADAFNAMLRNPTVPAVQHIQRWIGMEGVDNKQNQDGILGAITTDAISKFIEKCQTTNSVPSLVDQIPKPAPRATPAPVAPVKPDTAPQYSDPMGNGLGNAA